jgi:hypothetical protein
MSFAASGSSSAAVDPKLSDVESTGGGTWAYRYATEQLNVHGPAYSHIRLRGSRWRRGTAICARMGRPYRD